MLNDKQVAVSPGDESLCALAFKVIYQPQKGPLVFVRVYSGTLESKSTLRISSLDSNLTKTSQKERATKLLELYAEDYEEIPKIEVGNIGAILGILFNNARFKGSQDR
jgi:elongation factor G